MSNLLKLSLLLRRLLSDSSLDFSETFVNSFVNYGFFFIAEGFGSDPDGFRRSIKKLELSLS
jgi:hypothetical protein